MNTQEIEHAEPIEDIETETKAAVRRHSNVSNRPQTKRAALHYILLPFIFLTVTLLGGIRITSPQGLLAFLKPELLCLIFGLLTLVLFVRSRLFDLSGWFSEHYSLRQNVAAGVVLVAVYAATVQLFNALIPEQGLPYWVIAFCFFWMLWNYLFAELIPAKLVKSLIGMFSLAFAVKYLLLANLTAPAAGSGWLTGVFQNPGKEAVTYLLDLPRFSPATGYIQFFTTVLYVGGLYLVPARLNSHR